MPENKTSKQADTTSSNGKHALQLNLLKVQTLLKERNYSAVIIVSGVEGAGKGEVVNQLSEWFDVRDIQTAAFWGETDDQKRRPNFWRFWRVLPARGKISIMFGSWYSFPVLNHLFGNLDQQGFRNRLQYINEFEQMLTEDGTIIVKFWYQLSKDMVKQRVQEDAPIFELKIQKFPQLEKLLKNYDEFEDIAEQTLNATSTACSPWHVVDASDREYRNRTTGQILVNTFQDVLEKKAPVDHHRLANPLSALTPADYLAQTDLSKSLDTERYKNLLEQYQKKLSGLAWQAHYRNKSVVLVFEGWDAAGKGSVIRRISRAIDARLYKAISIGVPTDEELSHHYLWRFWRHVPQAGYMTIYDRSWYGRVLVERVEDYASEEEWKRAYAEIRHFEEQLTHAGIILLKFWMHISKEEQLRRFKERENKPWKAHKITEEDWRNRDKWDQYEQATNQMIAETSTENSQWQIIAAENKKFARIETLKSICESIQTTLDRETDDKR